MRDQRADFDALERRMQDKDKIIQTLTSMVPAFKPHGRDLIFNDAFRRQAYAMASRKIWFRVWRHPLTWPFQFFIFDPEFHKLEQNMSQWIQSLKAMSANEEGGILKPHLGPFPILW